MATNRIALLSVLPVATLIYSASAAQVQQPGVPDLTRWTTCFSAELDRDNDHMPHIGEDIFSEVEPRDRPNDGITVTRMAIVYRAAKGQNLKFVLMVDTWEMYMWEKDEVVLGVSFDFYTLSDDGRSVLIHEDRQVSTREKDRHLEKFFAPDSATGKAFIAWAVVRGEEPDRAESDIPMFSLEKKKDGAEIIYSFVPFVDWLGAPPQARPRSGIGALSIEVEWPSISSHRGLPAPC